MTWRELRDDYINHMPERFLDTEIQVYDCIQQETYVDAIFTNDIGDDDYVIDLNQPQIWINTEEVEDSE